MNRPTISIDRSAQKIAIFDGLDIVGKFEPYTDEAAALSEAKASIAMVTAKAPEVVYPKIESMKISLKRSHAARIS